PTETPQPLEEAAVALQMTPEEHYRRMMSALNEHGAFEEQQQQQQRLYQLANSMAVPSHGALPEAGDAESSLWGRMQLICSQDVLPEPGPGASRFSLWLYFLDSCREISHPPPLLSPQNAPHIALGPHLRPPFLGVPSALCQTPGYGFLQPAQAEMFARQQEMLRKQNLARRLKNQGDKHVPPHLPQTKTASLHTKPPSFPHTKISSPHTKIPFPPPRLETLAKLTLLTPKSPLTTPNSPHQNPFCHTKTPSLSTNATPPKEQPRRAGGSRKSSQPRAELQRGGGGGQDCNDEEMKDSESDDGAEVGEDKGEGVKAEEGGSSAVEMKECKDGALGKACEGGKEPGEAGAGGSASAESSPSHLLGPGMAKAEVKYLPPASLPAPQPLPFGFPYTVSPYFHAGEVPGAVLSAGLEQGCVWQCWNEGSPSCSLHSYCGCLVFREQAIDGETLPLLTEEHLLNNMGLKLGPALKIRSQVGK
ncbi:SAM11 protein, partial [Sterrhoptilus dennistouni]|nr:SAM11 protein [Sterrhoptilus dennistouni]